MLLKTTVFSGTTSVGAAGTTTGAGDNIADEIGNTWHRASGKLRKALGGAGYLNFAVDLDHPSVADQQIEYEAVGYSSADGGLRIVLAGASSQGYFVELDASGNGNVRITKQHRTNGPTTIATSSGTLDQGGALSVHNLLYRFSAVGASPTTLTLDIFDLTVDPTASSAILHVTGTDSTTGLQSTGYFGFTGLHDGSGFPVNITTARLYDLGVTPLAAGTAIVLDNTNVGSGGWEQTFSGVAPTGVAVAMSGPSGGTGPYSEQWQKSTDGGSTWSNVSGATNLIQAIMGLTAATAYKVKCVVTDAVSATANSNVLSFTTLTARAAGCVVKVEACDSTGAARATAEKTWIDAKLGRLDTVIKMCSLSGIASSHFAWANSNNWAKYACVIAQAEGCALGYKLGINDPDAATFNANVDDTVTNWVAQGITVYLYDVLYDNRTGTTGSDANVQNLLMNAHLESMVNGTTQRCGSRRNYDWMAAHAGTDMTANDVHPNSTGYPNLGHVEGQSYLLHSGTITPAALVIASTGGSTYSVTSADTVWVAGTPGKPALSINAGSISAQTLPDFFGVGSITTTQTSFTVTDPDSGASGSFAATRSRRRAGSGRTGTRQAIYG